MILKKVLSEKLRVIIHIEFLLKLFIEFAKQEKLLLKNFLNSSMNKIPTRVGVFLCKNVEIIYIICKTEIICNPHGYIDEPYNGYNKDLIIDI